MTTTGTDHGPAADRSTAVVRTKAEVRAQRATMSGTVAVVMTMGSLHQGHLMLVARAREVADHVILTDFVNPLQFGPNEDFDAYPRDLEGDVALVDGMVDLVFAPATEEMHPTIPPMVSVTTNRTGTLYEGASRPGHFDGVATVVTKLLNLTTPHIAVFGRKDAQQLAIVQSLVTDLDLPVRIEAVNIQRESEGLALSSRNLFLSAEGRRHALGLSATIAAAREAAPSLSGVLDALAAAKAGTAEYSADTTALRFDYALALDPATLQPVTSSHRGETLVMLAGWVDGTRLLDAAVVETTAP